jgi:hypothetical protein
LNIAAFDAVGWNSSHDVLANINKTWTSAQALRRRGGKLVTA